MSDKKLELSRRRVLGGLALTGAAAAGTGAGTFAYFSDTEESSGNTVSAGTLDLTPDGATGFSFGLSSLAPGESAGSPSVDLENSGSIDGDHLEFAAEITGDGGEPSEPNDADLANEVSNEAFAKQVFVENFTYDGTPVNWDGEAFPTLVDAPGALVLGDMALSRVADPAGGNRSGVLRATGTGYGVSMRDGFSTQLGNVSQGDLTLDWYAGASNTGAAPDEIFAVIEDTGGTRRLVYHTANYGSNSGDDNGKTWRSLDIGVEMGLVSGSPYNSNFNWIEIAPDNSNTYPDPNDGDSDGVADEGLNGDPGEDGQANSSFDDAAEIKALGFGIGNFGNSVQKDVYYDNLNVGSTTGLDLRPLSLYDLAKRGVADDLAGLSTTDTKTVSADLTFNPNAGNDYQAEGVTVDFQFGLAQDSSQDIL